MCGATTAPEAIRKLFRVNKLPNMPPRYNVVAPTDVMLVVTTCRTAGSWP